MGDHDKSESVITMGRNMQYAKYHLEMKAGAYRSSTVERDERSLSTVLAFFKDNLRLPRAKLSQVTVERLTRYTAWRRVQPGRGGGPISAQTLLHELNAVSNMFKRAVAESKAMENPVRRLLDKPRIDRDEAVHLEPGEAARLLKAAKQVDEEGRRSAFRCLFPLVATYLYKGARAGEIAGLEVGDIDFRNEVVWIRPNQHRTLKTRTSKRTIPLWPDLKAILEEYIGDRKEGLLFHRRDGSVVRDFRQRLDEALKRAKIEKRVTPKAFRHTYTAMRLQTTDGSRPVSVWQVACELGHRDTNLIESTCGHLLKTRDRASVVEYREAKVLPHMGARAG